MSHKHSVLSTQSIRPRHVRPDGACGCVDNDVLVVVGIDRFYDDLLLVTRRAWSIDAAESR